MIITGIVLLVVFGLVLILLEFLVVPGVTVAGIGGILLIAGGVFLSYDSFGNTIGNYTLGGASILIIGTIVFSMRSRTWKRTMLNTSIDSKVNTIEENTVKIGDTGVCISRLAPMGKVKVGDEHYEARANNAFLDPQTEVVVIKIENGKLIVKPKI